MSSEPNTRGFTPIFLLEEDHNKSDIEILSVFKRLTRYLTQKIRIKEPKRKQLCKYLTEERTTEKQKSSRCISFYTKSSGCNRFVSCEEINFNGFKKLSILGDCLPLKATGKKNSRNAKNLVQISLPDDIIEVILARSDFQTIAVARAVCKKWNEMITSSQFMHLREKLDCISPWLFLFKQLGEVFALDIVNDNWVTIRNDSLKDRFNYSVTSIGTDIYIIGGCSKSLHTTLKEVVVFSPLTNSCREISPMNVARLEPILGVFKLDSNCHSFQNRKTKQVQNQSWLNARSISSSEVNKNASNTEYIKFALIVVGGNWPDECPGEIYDPNTDKWTNIPGVPEEFGREASSGVVHGNKFYVHSTSSLQIASYDIEIGSWALVQTEKPHYPCIHTPRLISCKNRIFMCSVSWLDGTKPSLKRVLWEFDAEMNSWSLISIHPDEPMDMHALFCVDRDMIYGLEMFKVAMKGFAVSTVGRVSDDGVVWSRFRGSKMEMSIWMSMTVLHL